MALFDESFLFSSCVVKSRNHFSRRRRSIFLQFCRQQERNRGKKGIIVIFFCLTHKAKKLRITFKFFFGLSGATKRNFFYFFREYRYNTIDTVLYNDGMSIASANTAVDFRIRSIYQTTRYNFRPMKAN